MQRHVISAARLLEFSNAIDDVRPDDDEDVTIHEPEGESALENQAQPRFSQNWIVASQPLSLQQLAEHTAELLKPLQNSQDEQASPTRTAFTQGSEAFSTPLGTAGDRNPSRMSSSSRTGGRGPREPGTDDIDPNVIETRSHPDGGSSSHASRHRNSSVSRTGSGGDHTSTGIGTTTTTSESDGVCGRSISSPPRRRDHNNNAVTDNATPHNINNSSNSGYHHDVTSPTGRSSQGGYRNHDARSRNRSVMNRSSSALSTFGGTTPRPYATNAMLYNGVVIGSETALDRSTFAPGPGWYGGNHVTHSDMLKPSHNRFMQARPDSWLQATEHHYREVLSHQHRQQSQHRGRRSSKTSQHTWLSQSYLHSEVGSGLEESVGVEDGRVSVGNGSQSRSRSRSRSRSTSLQSRTATAAKRTDNSQHRAGSGGVTPLRRRNGSVNVTHQPVRLASGAVVSMPRFSGLSLSMISHGNTPMSNFASTVTTQQQSQQQRRVRTSSAKNVLSRNQRPIVPPSAPVAQHQQSVAVRPVKAMHSITRQRVIGTLTPQSPASSVGSSSSNPKQLQRQVQKKNQPVRSHVAMDVSGDENSDPTATPDATTRVQAQSSNETTNPTPPVVSQSLETVIHTPTPQRRHDIDDNDTTQSHQPHQPQPHESTAVKVARLMAGVLTPEQQPQLQSQQETVSEEQRVVSPPQLPPKSPSATSTDRSRQQQQQQQHSNARTPTPTSTPSVSASKRQQPSSSPNVNDMVMKALMSFKQSKEAVINVTKQGKVKAPSPSPPVQQQQQQEPVEQVEQVDVKGNDHVDKDEGSVVTAHSSSVVSHTLSTLSSQQQQQQQREESMPSMEEIEGVLRSGGDGGDDDVSNIDNTNANSQTSSHATQLLELIDDALVSPQRPSSSHGKPVVTEPTTQPQPQVDDNSDVSEDEGDEVSAVVDTVHPIVQSMLSQSQPQSQSPVQEALIDVPTTDVTQQPPVEAVSDADIHAVTVNVDTSPVNHDEATVVTVNTDDSAIIIDSQPTSPQPQGQGEVMIEPDDALATPSTPKRRESSDNGNATVPPVTTSPLSNSAPLSPDHVLTSSRSGSGQGQSPFLRQSTVLPLFTEQKGFVTAGHNESRAQNMIAFALKNRRPPPSQSQPQPQSLLSATTTTTSQPTTTTTPSIGHTFSMQDFLLNEFDTPSPPVHKTGSSIDVSVTVTPSSTKQDNDSMIANPITSLSTPHTPVTTGVGRGESLVGSRIVSASGAVDGAGSGNSGGRILSGKPSPHTLQATNKSSGGGGGSLLGIYDDDFASGGDDMNPLRTAVTPQQQPIKKGSSDSNSGNSGGGKPGLLKKLTGGLFKSKSK